ncbi:MAG: hypothetical protein DYG88_04610 [Chloroflexi bacterium CFX4]|nr:hypothetical protein [Chloroflexi bacterium CFX4]MDL1924565.1 hypothetical protein [Chloroflexi bacterium CFX3]
MSPFVETLFETATIRVGWYDAERTILVVEAEQGWTWDEALVVIMEVVNPAIQARAPEPIYSIYHHRTRYFPEGRGALSALRRMISVNVPNERLLIFVRQSEVLNTLLEVALRAFRMFSHLAHTHFVQTFEQALTIIQTDKRAREK